MLELRNRTPYEAALVPGLDRDGRDFATVVIKATFSLAGAGKHSPERLAPAEEPMPLVWADEFHGEPDASSLRYDADTGPARGGSDVALVGVARAPRGAVSELDVSLEIGSLAKRVRVFGERHWRRSLGFSRMSKPEPFRELPLVYERAFGGADRSHSDPAKHAFEERNPVGTGFTTEGKGDHLDELPLPNLEDPRALIDGPRDKPRPAGFGFVCRHWQPRRGYAGTYDKAWQAERCPLLPLDFDERHFRAAHPDLCARRPLAGGEPVRVANASPEGELRFPVPGLRFELRACVRGAERPLDLAIDSMLIEPELRRVALVWKATIPCSREFLLIDWVRIRELERFA